MPTCYYCDKQAVTKRKIYDSDMGCSVEADVCIECADYLDNQISPFEPDPYDPY